MKENVKRIYQWANELTAESKKAVWNEYYWTKETRILVERLKNTIKALIAIIGLQGVGKTILCEALAHKLYNEENKEVARFKWLGEKNIDEMIEMDESLYDIDDEYSEALEEELKLLPKEKISKIPELKEMLTGAKLIDDISLIEKKIGIKKAKEIKNSIIYEKLIKLDIILIDLPDYDKFSRKKMINDLNEICKFWNKLSREPSNTTLVIFFQKELFYGHFFMGKMDVFEIPPLKPQEMVEVYRQKFEKLEPFTEDALLNIAKMSRGVFRRFLKYIRMSIEEWINQGEKGMIDRKITEMTITIKQKTLDLELELLALYPISEENRRKVVELLDCLRRKGKVSQQEITKDLFDGNKMSASRMIRKLRSHDYIKIEKLGKENYIFQNIN